MQVYPYVDILRKRSHLNTVQHARDAHQSNQSVFGVKGPSPLLGIPDFNIIDRFVVDYMHCIDLGVIRYLSRLWFDSCNHAEAWFIGRHLACINNRLNNMHPPSSIIRLARSLLFRKFWKALEWRAFTVFYAPFIRHDILPAVYLEHFMLLSEALYLLLQENVTQANICQSRDLP